MSTEEWIKLAAVLTTVAGILATTAIALVTILSGRRREQAQQQRDDRLRRETQEREDGLRQSQRLLVPRIAYDLQCLFVGMQAGEWVTDIRLVVDNKGTARRAFRSMRLRLRAIRRDHSLTFWGDGPRLHFPEKLVDLDLIDANKDEYYYVEQGIKQVFNVPLKLPEDVTYVLLHVRLRTRFEDEGSPTGESRRDDQFDEERVFKVPCVVEATEHRRAQSSEHA